MQGAGLLIAAPFRGYYEGVASCVILTTPVHNSGLVGRPRLPTTPPAGKAPPTQRPLHPGAPCGTQLSSWGPFHCSRFPATPSVPTRPRKPRPHPGSPLASTLGICTPRLSPPPQRHPKNERHMTLPAVPHSPSLLLKGVPQRNQKPRIAGDRAHILI